MDMKKKYAQLLYQETVWLQDAGYCYPWQAVKEVRGMSMENHEAVAFIKEESSPAVHKEKQGRIWEGFFWQGDLTTGTLMEPLNLAW
jgi:hypothetical protein